MTYFQQDGNSSLCVTDETSPVTSPDSGQSLSPKNLRKTGQLSQPVVAIQQKSVKVPEPVQQQITY